MNDGDENAGSGPDGSLRDWLRSRDGGARLVLVAAHPDDEVIGAGAQLPGWRQAQIIHVTDGAPRNLRDAREYGFSSRQAYAAARKRELLAAMSLASISPGQLHQLDCPDQEASLNLVSLALRLAAMFDELRPDFVITHPYEGGHPDHDATAFAVHAACDLIKRPVILEMTSYFNRSGQMVSGEFLPGTDLPVTTFPLSPAQRELKQKLIACYATQQRVLAGFQLDRERFRLAPAYDFGSPPHEATLYYEMFDWGMTGPRWRALAQVARREMEATEPRCERVSPSGQLP